MGRSLSLAPTLANFHDICSNTALYFWAAAGAEKSRSWAWLSLLAILTLLVREDSGVVLFGIGFFLAVSRRAPRIGIGLCAY